jgi:hypothetical protein
MGPRTGFQTLLIAIVLVVILFITALPVSSVPLRQGDATQQRQTVNAVVQQRFTQTAIQVQAVTATASFEAAVNQAMNEVLTATQAGNVPAPLPVTSTHTIPGTATVQVDSAAFDISSATPFKAQHDVIEILVPKGWDIPPESASGQYQFTYNKPNPSNVNMQIVIGDPKTLYDQVIGVTTPVDSPKAALEAFKVNTPSDAQFTFGPIHAVKVGKLDGQGLTVTIPANAQRGATEVELWIAPLPRNQVIFVIMQYDQSIRDKARLILFQMGDSLVVNPQKIPTATPSSTPHPLRLTQTAIEAQIEKLTITPIYP